MGAAPPSRGHCGAPPRRRVLERFGLSEAADRRVKSYSVGMRRRLDLAAAFIQAPRVLFLDEPTTGLDPRSRTEVWRAVRGLADAGSTVLMTTQYLFEADQLARQIAVIDGGRVIADDTPERLKSLIGGDHLDLVVRDPARLGDAAAVLGGVAQAEPVADADARRLTAPVRDRVGRSPRSYGSWSGAASRSRTSPCGVRRWTRCSSA
ncbi:hypothetical protein GCM10027161_58270 [Microbispora hainanensis]